jgi:RpiB/LacA/LacB family sugar-phosphate isomerase
MSFSIQDFAVKNSPLTIAVGADHGGFEAKKALIAKLNANSIAVVDCGAYSYDEGDDYPEFAAAVAGMVSRGEADAGVLICNEMLTFCYKVT